MSTNLRNFTKAVYIFDAVVARTSDAGWDTPSGCPEWTGRELLQHQCAVLNGVAAVAATGQMARPEPPTDMSEPHAVWRSTRDELLETLDRPNVLQQEGPFWFDAPDVDALIGIVTWDPLTHAWDLAKCDAIDPALDSDLAAVMLARLEPMVPMLVESGRIGPPLDIAGDAPVVDRYLALVGRQS